MNTAIKIIGNTQAFVIVAGTTVLTIYNLFFNK
jgi:hypothetical protein